MFASVYLFSILSSSSTTPHCLALSSTTTGKFCFNDGNDTAAVELPQEMKGKAASQVSGCPLPQPSR
jgi:hypothetical protein